MERSYLCRNNLGQVGIAAHELAQSAYIDFARSSGAEDPFTRLPQNPLPTARTSGKLHPILTAS